MKKKMVWLAAMLVVTCAAGVGAAEAPLQIAKVVRSYPHDPHASTQGLVFFGDHLLESTGGYGRSTLRRVDPATGQLLLSRDLPPELFGEGLAVHGGVLYQLTWLSGTVLRYDPETLSPLESLQIGREAWGLASDGERLVMSDGSAVLRFVDPANFDEIGRIVVRDGAGEVPGLNELEFVQGLLFANVYPTSEVVMIDPATGAVVGRLDLSALAPQMEDALHTRVANGIAYDPATGRLLVTGKLWPAIFQVEVPKDVWSSVPPGKISSGHREFTR
ncbi:MAG: glutaminyl-peptide cyclotransferase [Desulfuromonadales bacterium]|nr:glutaminyl-peptide cyclotransferase [Desulfuromonadales bacterium]